MIIGLTGGIASGKSFVAEILRNLGAEVIDADDIYHKLIQPGSSLYKEIVSKLGRGILSSDGSIDRKKLGNLIFSNDGERQKLNALTHPYIIEAIKEQLIKKDAKVIVIVAPLLIESGQETLVDELWLVAVNRKRQVQRLIKRDNLSLEDAEKRIESQMSQDAKKRYADFIIDNSGTHKMTIFQVIHRWEIVKALIKESKKE